MNEPSNERTIRSVELLMARQTVTQIMKEKSFGKLAWELF